MNTYYKTTPEILYPCSLTPADLKVKSIIFRNDIEKCNIDCIGIDGRGSVLWYEQWSIPDNKKNYRQCHKELRSYGCQPFDTAKGEILFQKYDKQKAVAQQDKPFNMEEVYSDVSKMVKAAWL